MNMIFTCAGLVCVAVSFFPRLRGTLAAVMVSASGLVLCVIGLVLTISKVTM